MTPAESRRLAALEAEFAALRRAVGNARGLGVNTTGGAIHYRTTQLGFAAELTAAWDATDGYAWKRLRLEGVSLNDPGIQLTGTGAVTPDGNEELVVGDRGWMEPSPDAQGFLFLSGGSAASSTCRSMLVGRAGDSAFTGEIQAGTGKCANVAASTIYFAYDATVGTGSYGGWASTAFTTRAGDTTVSIFLDDRGNPAATITDGTNTRYMTFEGCSGGRMKFTTFDCLWCDDVWDGPCGDNRITLLVSCGVVVCDQAESLPTELRFYLMASFGRLAFLRFGDAAAGPEGYETVVAGRGAFWGAKLDASDPFGGGGGWYSNTYVVLIDWIDVGDDGCMTLEYYRSGAGASDPPVLVWSAGVTLTPDTSFPFTFHHSGSDGVTELTVEASAGDGIDLCADDVPGSVSGSGGGEVIGDCDGVGEELEDHPPLEIVIPDGPSAGTYTLLYNGLQWENSTFSPPISLFATSGMWRLAVAGTEIDIGWATAGSCSPFGLVFAGTTFGGTGDITVSVA